MPSGLAARTVNEPVSEPVKSSGSSGGWTTVNPDGGATPVQQRMYNGAKKDSAATDPPLEALATELANFTSTFSPAPMATELSQTHTKKAITLLANAVRDHGGTDGKGDANDIPIVQLQSRMNNVMKDPTVMKPVTTFEGYTKMKLEAFLKAESRYFHVDESEQRVYLLGYKRKQKEDKVVSHTSLSKALETIEFADAFDLALSHMLISLGDE
jgi:hypothetical protein